MHHLRQLLSQVVGIGLAFCCCGLVGAYEPPSVEESTQVRRSIALNQSLPFIGADLVHAAGYTGRGTTVVVIGRFGVDNTLEGLNDGDVREGYSIINGVIQAGQGFSADSHDDVVAYIITGPDGVAPDAEILPFRTFTLQDIIEAIDTIKRGKQSKKPEYATVNVVCIVQAIPDQQEADDCSCDNTVVGKPLERKLSLLKRMGLGVHIFAGSGKGGVNVCERVELPACASSAEAVAAVYDGNYAGPLPYDVCIDPGGIPHRPTCFSNRFGQGCDGLLGAPGHEITTPLGTEDGTSFATPHVAEIALYHTLGRLPEPELAHKFC